MVERTRSFESQSLGSGPPVEAFPPPVLNVSPQETNNGDTGGNNNNKNNRRMFHRFRRVAENESTAQPADSKNNNNNNNNNVTESERFQRGDHVYQWCSLLGIPGVFQHHGIVIHVEDMPQPSSSSLSEQQQQQQEVQQLITIADFSNLLWGNKESSSVAQNTEEMDPEDGDDEEMETHSNDNHEDNRRVKSLEEESCQALQEETQTNNFRHGRRAGQGSLPFLRCGSSASTTSSSLINSKTSFLPAKEGWLRVYTTTSTKDCKWHKVIYQDNWFHTHLWKRSGTCTPASSDPPEVVMQRVNFLLTQSNKLNQYCYGNSTNGKGDSLLPEYHSIYSNCECVAVWCKTGTWSTLQAASFLSHAAVGQVKGTATIAGIAAAQTVSVPAAGVWGWLGYSTTVPLMSVNPFVLPAICAYGAVTVGGPAVCLAVAKKRWKETSQKLNAGLEAESLEVNLVT